MKKESNKRKKLIIISALSLAVLLVIGLAVTLAIVLNKSVFVDYLNDDLSKYVYISKDKYTDIPIDIDIKAPDNMDVEIEIMKKQVGFASLVGDGAYKTRGTLGVGDKVQVYYLGYLLSDNGERSYFDGGCNFADNAPYNLVLGSGAFIAGFEYDIIGKRAEDYPSLERITSGAVAAGQVVYVSGGRREADGTLTTYNNVRLELGESADKIMGVGFTDAVLGKPIGEDLSNIKTAVDGESLTFVSLKVNFATECEENPLTVRAYFPTNYGEESLAGKTAYFDVYIQRYVDYEVPEFNDGFITESLKIKSEALDEYEGSTLAEKYKNAVMSDLTEQYQEERAYLIESAVWNYLAENTEIKKLPEDEVDRQYDIYHSELTSLYEYYGTGYTSLGDFIRAWYGLSQSADWQKFLRSEAEGAVAEKLIFYYIIRDAGYLPSDAEYQRLFDAAVDAELEAELAKEGCDREDYATDEAYEAAVSAIRRGLIADRGEGHFADTVYYDYGFERILKNVVLQ